MEEVDLCRGVQKASLRTCELKAGEQVGMRRRQDRAAAQKVDVPGTDAGARARWHLRTTGQFCSDSRSSGKWGIRKVI